MGSGDWLQWRKDLHSLTRRARKALNRGDAEGAQLRLGQLREHFSRLPSEADGELSRDGQNPLFAAADVERPPSDPRSAELGEKAKPLS